MTIFKAQGLFITNNLTKRTPFKNMILAGYSDIIPVLLIVAFPILIGLLIYYAYKYQENSSLKSQHKLTDKELLELFPEQPDGLITAKGLSESTGLKLKDAKNRLSLLYRLGVIAYHSDSKMKYHYFLREPIKEVLIPDLSPEPFLTVEDILKLFKAFDFKLTYQKVCMSTGLPIAIVKKEFDYFIKEKIMHKVFVAGVTGVPKGQIFLLKEPYRSNPDKFLERERKINLELKEIYIKETKGDK